MANGRCRMHGGKTPKGADSPHFKTGRYSKHAPEALRAKIEAFQQQDDPFDLLDELATQRALFADYLERLRVAGMYPTMTELSSMLSWLESIGKMVERMQRLRNDTALTAAEITFLKARVLDTVTRYIDNPTKQQQFIADLFGLDDSIGQRHPERITATASARKPRE